MSRSLGARGGHPAHWRASGGAIMTRPPVAEPIACPDVFVSGHLEVETVQMGILRVTFIVNQREPYGGSLERRVVANIVGQRSTLHQMARAVLKATGEDLRAAEIMDEIYSACGTNRQQ